MLRSTASPNATSGAMYHGVPIASPCTVINVSGLSRRTSRNQLRCKHWLETAAAASAAVNPGASSLARLRSLLSRRAAP